MRKELFGVFGDHSAFRTFRTADAFDAVLGGETVTVGVRDPSLGVPGRTTYHETDDGLCVVWGEVFAPGDTDPAQWLLSRYATAGLDAFDRLNGSYVAVVERDGEAVVATDQMRSWECFYADVGDTRAFGTDCRVLKWLLDEPRACRRSLLEFLHLSVVLGDRTLFDRIRRVPFDGYLAAGDVGEFARFTYEPESFDYAAELAARLRDALARRADYPGPSGLLLSAGQDSRSVLAGPPEIDHCYTIGSSESQEGRVARQLATQYGVAHTALAPDGRYLATDDEKIRYTQSVRESLQIHHAGYDDEFEMETVYHGLLYDTLFKGYFLEPARRRVLGTELRRKRLAGDVDPGELLLDTFAYRPDESLRLEECAGELFPGVELELDDPGAFLRERLEDELGTCRARADSVYNGLDLFALRTQPASAFRTHLADNYLESFVAADADLLEWHRRTPPRYRHPETVHDALAMLDEDVFRHPPPGRRTRSELLNQVDRFVRRTLPVLDAREPAWPDYTRLYEENDLDEHLFPDCSTVRDLPVRWKLRVNDARWWLH